MGIRNSKAENILIIIAFGTDCHVDPLGLLAMTGFFDSLSSIRFGGCCFCDYSGCFQYFRVGKVACK